MPLLVSWCRLSSPGAAAVRAVIGYENIASGAATANRAADEGGVMAIVYNSETVPGRVAWGTTADATAAAATAATTAGLVIGPGREAFIHIAGGEEIHFTATV